MQWNQQLNMQLLHLTVKYTHILPFKALLDFVRDYLGELAQKGKTNLDLLEQEIASGSGTS